MSLKSKKIIIKIFKSLIFVKQEAQLSLGKADRTAYVRSSASELQSQRKGDLSEVRQFYARYVNETLFQKLQWTPVGLGIARGHFAKRCK